MSVAPAARSEIGDDVDDAVIDAESRTGHAEAVGVCPTTTMWRWPGWTMAGRPIDEQ